MSRISTVLLPNSGTNASLVGDPVRCDAFSGQHTVAIRVNDLRGRVYVEATLAMEPTANDWFPIKLDALNNYLQFPLDAAEPTGTLGDTGTYGYTFRGNYLFMRARLDRAYLLVGNETPEQIAPYGAVDRILLNS